MPTRSEKKPLSLTIKIFGLIVLAISLLSAVFAFMVMESQVEIIAENGFLTSLRLGFDIQDQLERLDSMDQRNLAEHADSVVADLHDSRIYAVDIVDIHGAILYTSGDTVELAGEDRRQVHTAVTRWEFEQRVFHHDISIGDRTIKLFMPIIVGGEMAVIIVNVSIGTVDEQMQILIRQILILIGLIIVVFGGIGYYTYRRILVPIGFLAAAQDRLSKGDFDVVLPYRNDEIGQLFRGFRRLSKELYLMMDSARSANPLTGLPGNVELEKRLRTLLTGDKISCVMYYDLDNFKAYNDIYGFTRGDDVILLAKDSITRSFCDATEDYFVGHEGGDDFVAVCDFADWETAAQHCISTFDSEIRNFYTSEDISRGYIETKDRKGDLTKFPIVSMSIAVVSNRDIRFSNVGEIVEAAADLKKFVKSKEGSNYFLDRRKELMLLKRIN